MSTLQVIFSKYAKLELEDAINFYEMEYNGLGQQFKNEAKKTVLRISEYLEAWSTEHNDIRNMFIS